MQSTTAKRTRQARGWALAMTMVAALGLAACQPASTPAQATETALPASATMQAAEEPASAAASAGFAASAAFAASAVAQAAPLQMRGIYVWGSEVETFSPCNTDKAYWLEGDEQLLAPLQELAIRKADAANEAYQPIYVEVQVRDMGRATDGFAVDYDGVMQLLDVRSSSLQVPADCKLLDVPANPPAQPPSA